jgi:hypothetical protein
MIFIIVGAFVGLAIKFFEELIPKIKSEREFEKWKKENQEWINKQTDYFWRLI